MKVGGCDGNSFCMCTSSTLDGQVLEHIWILKGNNKKDRQKKNHIRYQSYLAREILLLDCGCRG